MAEKSKDERIRELQQEICNLTSDLASSNSDVGDWKYIKSYEYQRAGKDTPYDLDELDVERQRIRDRINECKREIKELEDDQA